MKIVFISDIHGSIDNLDKIDFDFDKLVVLGDLFGLSASSNKVIADFLRANKEKLILLKGNCDNSIMLNKLEVNYYDHFDLKVDGLIIRCLHGHILETSGSDVIVMGHKHYPFIQKADGFIQICVGSLGYPRNDSLPSYAVYENRSFKIIDINAKIVEEIML